MGAKTNSKLLGLSCSTRLLCLTNISCALYQPIYYQTMADTTTIFAQISSFFMAFFAYVFGVLSLKHRSTTLCDDLEVGIPSVEQRVSSM
jgi:hypothetical protein